MLKLVVAINNQATISVVKLVQKAVRLLGRGEGTALPGLISEKMSPKLLKFFADQIPHKILITGTNGKTTTQIALSSILRASGKRVLANASGSNMRRGLLSLFISKCDRRGKLNYDYAVLEIEEATLPKVVQELNPEVLVFTNLYRDQLDAYAEIDRTKEMFVKALKLSPQAKVVFNGDDPRLSDILKGLENECLKFGLDPSYILDFKYEGEHLKNQKNDLVASKIKINDDLGTRFQIEDEEYSFASPGIFNVYNALAAVASAKSLKILIPDIKKGLLLMKTPFGRGEVLKKNSITYRLLLAKNPAGLNLVFQLLKHTNKPNLIILLNDKIADGRDVSWIWDADFGLLKDIGPNMVILGGSRAEELLLRLKYTFEDVVKMGERAYLIDKKIQVFFTPDIKELVNFVEREKLSKYFYVIHTYTAMLEFRKRLLGKALNE